MALCWLPIWNTAHPGIGLERVEVGDGWAESCLLAIDENGESFRLDYRLTWHLDSNLLEGADLTVRHKARTRTLTLRVDALGRWLQDDVYQPHLDGCVDIDIWPTPLTNSFPIWRSKLKIGERREFRAAWVAAPELTVTPKAQAYTRLAERSYLFESLDGDGFSAMLEVDERGFVVDYPGLFMRVVVGVA